MIYLYFIQPFLLWRDCKAFDIDIDYLTIVGMNFRKTKPRLICQSLITLKMNSIEVKSDQLEALYLGGGDVQNITDALILDKVKSTNIGFAVLFSYELAGINSLECVEKSTPENIYNPFT